LIDDFYSTTQCYILCDDYGLYCSMLWFVVCYGGWCYCCEEYILWLNSLSVTCLWYFRMSGIESYIIFYSTTLCYILFNGLLMVCRDWVVKFYMTVYFILQLLVWFVVYSKWLCVIWGRVELGIKVFIVLLNVMFDGLLLCTLWFNVYRVLSLWWVNILWSLDYSMLNTTVSYGLIDLWML
jgi:hypothetical protein